MAQRPSVCSTAARGMQANGRTPTSVDNRIGAFRRHRRDRPGLTPTMAAATSFPAGPNIGPINRDRNRTPGLASVTPSSPRGSARRPGGCPEPSSCGQVCRWHVTGGSVRVRARMRLVAVAGVAVVAMVAAACSSSSNSGNSSSATSAATSAASSAATSAASSAAASSAPPAVRRQCRRPVCAGPAVRRAVEQSSAVQQRRTRRPEDGDVGRGLRRDGRAWWPPPRRRAR